MTKTNSCTDRNYSGMTEERYDILESDARTNLTSEEIKAGWHFCVDWDGMLIHESWPEYEACGCSRIARLQHGN